MVKLAWTTKAAPTAMAFLSLCLTGCSSTPNQSESRGEPSISHVTRIAILNLGSESKSNEVRNLGIDIDADMIARFRQALDAERPDIVIVGVSAEGDSISDSLQIARELEKIEAEYRTVAWVKCAVTKALFAAMTLDEMYMYSQANCGATSHSNGCWAREAISLEEVLGIADGVSAAGQRDPRILRSMIVPFPLSATRVGDTTLWFGDHSSGETIVNREGEILCFNSSLAKDTGVSKGTADDIASLCRLVGIETYVIVAKDASERVTREAEERSKWTERLNEECSRSQAKFRSMADMIAIGTASKARLVEAKSDAEASLDRLSELAKQHPRLAHKLDVEKLEGEPTKKRQRWFLPEAREGLAELSRRSQ